jgi:hypothetical protein
MRQLRADFPHRSEFRRKQMALVSASWRSRLLQAAHISIASRLTRQVEHSLQRELGIVLGLWIDRNLVDDMALG